MLRRLALIYGTLALAFLVAILLIGRSSAIQTERTLRAEILERNATVVTQEARIQRLRADSVTLAAKVATRGVRASGANVDSSRVLLEATLDSSKAVLADMEATGAELRAALGRTVVRAESLVTQITVYRGKVDSLLTLVDAEREARRIEGERVNAALEAKDATIAAYRKAAECRVLWVRCPTRTQVAVGTAITTYLIVRKDD